MRIADHLEPPESTDLDAFIARLDDSDDRIRRHLRQFVLARSVQEQLDSMLGEVGRRLGGGKDIGRFIYGSFGSGKSHLLTVLGKMLERDAEVYDVGHRGLSELRESNPWLSERKVLVVRLNMMGKKGLSTALFEAFNDALPPDAPKISFTNEARVFELIERDSERMGGLDGLLTQAAQEGYLNFPPAHARRFYDVFRRGDLDKRLSLAAGLLSWRNHGGQAVTPDALWLDARAGFERLAQHAHDLGYEAITWLVDELVIWIREKDRSTYIKQVNDLSALVDHDAHRALPFFVAVAVQMDIAQTCPDDISEKDFREQLGFISNRFQPALHLEDQDLYVVASQRVLARRPELSADQLRAFEAAVDRFLQKNANALRALSGDLEPELIRSLYPFHPALLRVLVDVTQALSRNRTAIAALYGMLAAYPELKVGQLVPLAALWDILFTADNIQALRQNARSSLAQQLADTAETWLRLEGKVAAVARDMNTGEKELTSLVRSALLCQLSARQYFPDGRALNEAVTASMLLRLNQTDVRAVTERTGIAKVARMLRRLNGIAPQVQIIGEGNDPLIRVKTEQVDIEKVLARARAEVGFSDRFAFVRKLLIDQLGLRSLKRGNEGTQRVVWRGTTREGQVKIVNVRTQSYAGRVNEFDPGSREFLILIDYPFDEEPGRTRQDDIDTISRARARASHWTVAWLPEHFSSAEREALDNAAAVELIRKNERAYLEDYGARDAREIKRALEAFLGGRQAELEEAVRRLYFEQGQVVALKDKLGVFRLDGVDRGRALDAVGRHVLDVRYPNHPPFERRVGLSVLMEVGDFVFRAANTGQAVDLNAAQLALAEAIAVPLQLVYKESSRISPRTDGRFLRPVLEWVKDRARFDGHELRALLMAEDGWGFGLSKEVANFFLLYLLQVRGYEARVDDRSKTVQGLRGIPKRFVLVKDEVVDSPTWDRALRAAEQLLGLRGRSDLPTSPEQAKLVRDVIAASRELRASLSDAISRLSTVCAFTQVMGSRTLAALQGLSALLDRLNNADGNAARTRTLADALDDDGFYAWSLLRAHLDAEAQMLGRIVEKRNAFETTQQHGTPAEKRAVCVSLKGWLSAQVSEANLLSKKALKWPAKADQTLAAILRRKFKHPLDTRTCTGTGEELRADALAALEALLQRQDGDGTLRVTISVGPAR